MKIEIQNDYHDPEKRKIEIVERKGIGHPDTLADKLAEELSRQYSIYCLDNFGCILHHNIDKLFIPVIKRYLSSVMPRLNPDTDLNININCTQYSKREHWYTPRNKDDVPDSKELFAADTALCVNHGCMTFCEKLAFLLEQSFWEYSDLGYAFPKYNDVGQDIKVMISRIDKAIIATVCMPVYKDMYSSRKEYELIG